MMMQVKRHILDIGGIAGAAAIHPRLADLRRLWEEKRGDRRAPCRADFSISDLRPWFGHLMVLDCQPGETFRYRLYGTELVALFGFDLTGRTVAEAANLIGKQPQDEYRQVLFSGEPLYVSRSSPSSREYLAVDKLALPLIEDGLTTKILGAIYLSDET